MLKGGGVLVDNLFLLFGDLFVTGYVQWHCNGDWVFQ